MSDRARTDVNNQYSLIAVSSLDGVSPVTLFADPVSHTLLTTAGASGGAAAKSTTGTASTTALSTVSAPVLASNSARLGATIFNEGTATAYLAYGATASTTAYAIQIASLGYYELPASYSGALSAITIAGTATLRVTELT